MRPNGPIKKRWETKSKIINTILDVQVCIFRHLYVLFYWTKMFIISMNKSLTQQNAIIPEIKTKHLLLKLLLILFYEYVIHSG